MDFPESLPLIIKENHKSNETHQELDFLEQQIPILAETAMKQAYWQTLTSGDKVMIAENGFLVEVSPDGSRKVVKEIGKPIRVTERFFTIVK